MRVRLRHPKPLKPAQHRFWYTEGIDYLTTGKRSIWGSGDPKTLKILRRLHMKGTWLHLAAGDGRYNSLLLRKVDTLIVSDIDPSALEKSRRNVPPQYRGKFLCKVFDLVKRFPLKAQSIDGVFCVGTLHCFPKHILKKIAREIDRVLKSHGTLFVDFTTNAKRVRLDGKPYIIKGEPPYTIADAKATLQKTFPRFAIKFWRGVVPKESYPRANPPYTFESQYLIMVAKKPKPKL